MTMKKITVINSSFRKNGNTDHLAANFIKGAKENGDEVNLINLKDIRLNFCHGCLACEKLKKCVQNDDINSLLDDIQNSDILVFASPIYYYEMSGQLKTFLDRMNPLYYRENKFKYVYALFACANGNEDSMDRAINGIKGFVECFSGVTFKGSVNAAGFTSIGEIKDSHYLQDAYDLGKNI